MHNSAFASIRTTARISLIALGMSFLSSAVAAQSNTFSGTYTFVFGIPDEYSIQLNMFGQEVGFCPASATPPSLPFGYSCSLNLFQDVLTGTLVADGNGNITTGSNYVFTVDPNKAQCSTKYNATPDCPYKVPSGITWNSTANYVIGDEVDFTVNGSLLTFQAVANNSNVLPTSSTCTSNVQVPPNCTWDQLYVSATGKTGSKGSLTGKYTVQANASGVLQLTPAGQKAISMSIIVPASPLAVGQEIPLVGLPTSTNEIRGSGSAVRVK